jgi:hypothetical protein
MQSLSKSNNNKEIVWKRELSEILKKHGLIGENFTGEISINISQGGVSNLKKIEYYK